MLLSILLWILSYLMPTNCLAVDLYDCADQECFTEERLGYLSGKIILNILIVNQHLCLKFVDSYAGFLAKETLV